MTDTTKPACLHFGLCGGCQHQDVAYPTQLVNKHEALAALLNTVAPGIDITQHSSEPYGYRNRIRLRVQHVDGQRRVGYTLPASSQFLPIRMCPIAAPILWHTAEALLAKAINDGPTAAWLDVATEIELFASDDLQRIQLTLLLPNNTKLPQHPLDSVRINKITGIGAVYIELRTGRALRQVVATGAAGLNYRVAVSSQSDETYWISRGGFFQINRFLISTLVELVTAHRSGTLAWDLYAGVGLFSRVLARSFQQVTAVEANPTAVQDLQAAFTKLGRQHTAIEATTLDFLQHSITQRERPDLIVLDPPRAGAGTDACRLLTRLAPREIIYVSCDPNTLARDLHVLTETHRITALHLVDLFPQTSHMETVAILQRDGAYPKMT
jgi:23S rRNA (uracil1939-C5)-methyltransferase